MTSALLALAVAAADQENVNPSIDIIANVRSSARGVRAAHIDGSAKETRKRSRGPRSSDAEKIESTMTPTGRSIPFRCHLRCNTTANDAQCSRMNKSLVILLPPSRELMSRPLHDVIGVRHPENGLRVEALLAARGGRGEDMHSRHPDAQDL
jgi:hypothetical protein